LQFWTCMVMSDRDIVEAMRKGEIRILPELDEDTQLQPASVDLRVGAKVFKTTPENKVVVLTESEGGFLVIEPSEFVAVQTLEQIQLSKGICGRMGLRCKFTRRGLLMFSGPQIDPGFHGILTLSLFNATNRAVSMRYGELFCTVEFSRTDTEASQGYAGRYQGALDFRSEDISYLMEVKGMSFAQVVSAVQSLQESVKGLDATVEELRDTFQNVQQSFKETVDRLGRNIQIWLVLVSIVILVGLPLILKFLLG